MKAKTFIEAVNNIHHGRIDLSTDVLQLRNSFGHTVAHVMAMRGYVFKRAQREVLDWKTDDGITVRQLQQTKPTRYFKALMVFTAITVTVLSLAKATMILNDLDTVGDVKALAVQKLIARSNANGGPVTRLKEERAEHKRMMMYVNMQRNKAGKEPWGTTY